jgi:3-isopropylmalate/(R)-2-methylmalate dehydratase small subunit
MIKDNDMEPFTQHTGIVAPLDRVNVDTDCIIPKQFLRKIERTGFGQHLFHELRYTDYEGTQENPEFMLNQPEFRAATVLVARDNFGCGSSREHAPWSLADYGFKVIIAPSFADIFYNNCTKNGILLVKLNSDEVDHIFQLVAQQPGLQITADLNEQTVRTPDGTCCSFDIQPFAKNCLLNGLDQIGWTLQFEAQIERYETQVSREFPWL